jgi:hypothetical protein
MITDYSITDETIAAFEIWAFDAEADAMLFGDETDTDFADLQTIGC